MIWLLGVFGSYFLIGVVLSALMHRYHPFNEVSLILVGVIMWPVWVPVFLVAAIWCWIAGERF